MRRNKLAAMAAVALAATAFAACGDDDDDDGGDTETEVTTGDSVVTTMAEVEVTTADT